MKSYKIRIWSIQTRQGRRSAYSVRWVVNGRTFTETFTEFGLADSYRSELITAARKNGEPFDTESGLPDSMRRAREAITWFEHARDYVEWKWPRASGNSRRSIIESMVAVTPVLVRKTRGAPQPTVMREALRWAFIPSRDEDEQPEHVVAALEWLEKASLPIGELLSHTVAARAVSACARLLDGSEAAPEYYRRRRRVLYNSVRYAVRQGRLEENPLDSSAVTSEWKQPDVDDAVDPRVVGNPEQVAEALIMCTYAGRRQGPRLAAFFGCMYYAMMRPAEVSRLREDECKLPESGWGELVLAGSNPEVGKDYSDSGELHDNRPLKGRSKKTVRVIPIPPELVILLRHHIQHHGVASDGRLFRSESGRPLPKSTFSRAWTKVRLLALTPAQHASPLMGQPYDLRHAGITWRLAAGVPAGQVADWAGNSVEVLQRVYHLCMSGYDDVWIKKMDRARKEL